jgi:hypothetical protein
VSSGEGTRPVRRLWVPPQVAIEVDTLWARTNVAEARGLDPAGEALVQGVRVHLDKARNAAYRRAPLPTRSSNWWRGTLIETADRHLHAAEVQLVDLYDLYELQATIRPTVVRANAILYRGDSGHLTVEEFLQYSPEQLRPRLRDLMRETFAALDSQQAQLRSFSKIVLGAALSITALVLLTVSVVSRSPDVLPFCFPNEVVDARFGPAVTTSEGLNCPTGSGAARPNGGDVLLVALVGLLGGALAAVVSIRSLKLSTTPYDVPVALAMLKIPLGAFTAILGLVAIRGELVPGLSSLDSQGQILAYALVLGYAQQLLTRLLDQQAHTLLEGLVSKEAAEGASVRSPSRTAPAAVDGSAARPLAPDGYRHGHPISAERESSGD